MFILEAILKRTSFEYLPWAMVDPIPPRMEPPPSRTGAGGGAWRAAKKKEVRWHIRNRYKTKYNSNMNTMNSNPNINWNN